MAYKYINAIPTSLFVSTGCTILNEFQSFIDDQFYNAPDAYLIQEEIVLGSGVYSDVEVRINHAVSSLTGKSLGDDFKQIIFKDLYHSASIGTKYYFDNNYFVTVNTEILKNFAASSTVRRCNNLLRWKDENGVFYSEPVVLEYEISRPRDSVGTENPVVPAGYINAYCQLNSKTRKIKGNQRFLFGPPENRICLKTFGNGVKNFLNQKTLDDSSGTLLELSLGGNFVNPDTDDIVNGIADAFIDYGNLQSGSAVSNTLSIVVNPSVNYLLNSGSQNFNVNYYSGSSVVSGFFTFSVSGSLVPVDNYIFSPVDGNNFILYNIIPYLENTLDILASGSSGSRLLNFSLRDKW